jgi:hypothetical protein
VLVATGAVAQLVTSIASAPTNVSLRRFAIYKAVPIAIVPPTRKR